MMAIEFLILSLLLGQFLANPVDKEGRKLRIPDPEEIPGLVEGDMIVPPKTGTFRSTIKEESYRWPNARVPYMFSPREKEQFSDEEKQNITAAMEQFHTHTCVRFVPWTDEEHYVIFRKGSGCSSNVGMLVLRSIEQHSQKLSLGKGCFILGKIMHEMMHALGFYHEQERWDRDDYVDIKAENIIQGYIAQFRTFNPERANFDLGAPYDYSSLMHYPRTAFALYEDEETIVPLAPGVEIGQRVGFSPIDIWKINKLYKCPQYRDVTLAPELHSTPAKPDYIFNPTPPPKTKETFYCNFDYMITCGMRDDLDSKFDWELRKGPTPSEDTGPDADASGKASGYYVYTETSLRNAGDKAFLATPFLTPSPEGACLKFNYHMHGPEMGTLQVYARDYLGNKQMLFEKSGEQGNEWKAYAETIKTEKPFEIVFESTVGGPIGEFSLPNGDMAIDNFEFRPLAKYPNLGCEAGFD